MKFGRFDTIPNAYNYIQKVNHQYIYFVDESKKKKFFVPRGNMSCF